jgi:hypothetical protein
MLFGVVPFEKKQEGSVTIYQLSIIHHYPLERRYQIQFYWVGKMGLSENKMPQSPMGYHTFKGQKIGVYPIFRHTQILYKRLAVSILPWTGQM